MLHSKDSLALRQWLSISGLTGQEITWIRRDAMQSPYRLYAYCARLDEPRIAEIYLALDRLRSTRNDFEEFRRALREFPNLLVAEELFRSVGLTIDEAAQEPRSVGSLIPFIYEKFGLIDSEGDVPEDDKVLVTTLHSAKGLEAEYVFVAWLNSKYLPLPQRDAGEQRRVLYVALTRAKQDVILTFHETFDKKQGRLGAEAMSPFLHEITNHLDRRRITAADVR